MAKIPDFSKFDLQGIVNSVKSIINPESGTPRVSEGDPIGAKIVTISTLLQTVADAQAQSAKNLTQINNLLNELYKDLEAVRALQAELNQKQQAAEATVSPTTASQATDSVQTTAQKVPPSKTQTTGQSKASVESDDIETSQTSANLKDEAKTKKHD